MFFDGTISVTEQKQLVAECVATHLLKRDGLCADDDAIERVTRALASEPASALFVVGL